MSTATGAIGVPVRRATRRRLPADVTALARLEGRRLVRHPVFLIGLLLSVAVVIAASTASDGFSPTSLLSGIALFPLAAATMVVANLGALRSRRDGTDELYASLPSPCASRAAGQLLALAWTLPISVGLITVVYVGYGAQNGVPINYLGVRQTPAFVQLVQGPLVVIALGAVGVLLARITASPIVVTVLVIVSVVVGIPLSFWVEGSWLQWLAPLANDAVTQPGSWVPCRAGQPMPVGDRDPGCVLILRHDRAGMAWHVSYLVALTLLAGAASLLRGRRRPALLVALIPVLAVASALAAG